MEKIPSVTTGEKLQSRKLKHRVEPVYPEAARARRLKGEVRLRIEVNEKGRVTDSRVLAGEPLLAESARQAVRQWTYSPTLFNGRPVPVVSYVTLKFAPPVAFAKLLIPAGTPLAIRLAEPLSSRKNSNGQHFRGQLARDLARNGHLIAGVGAPVWGTIVGVERSGRVRGRARLCLILNGLQVQTPGRTQDWPIATETLTLEAAASRGRDTGRVAAGATLGALVGALAGGKRGAMTGAAAGVGAGTALVLATAGDHVELGVETLLNFKLAQPFAVEVPM